MPALSERIGLPWVGERPLVVAEAINRSTAGYSGRYDPATGRIEIAYYADSFVVLHEAAHAWFNGSLLAERWANEGFASWYALDGATAIGEKVTVTPLTPELGAAEDPAQRLGTGRVEHARGRGLRLRGIGGAGASDRGSRRCRARWRASGTRRGAASAPTSRPGWPHPA